MGFDSSEPEQSRGLQAVLTAGSISTESLWLHYVSVGGSMGELEVEAYLQGLLSIPAFQRDILAFAANELWDSPTGPHAPYTDELGPLTPEEPLAP
ncbi:hypothetical protein [Paenarthrobacter sp. NPDC018779]|uniref:hypothetical protein n=1 Tax=Paenarthrobacter sp. NPDC018779 TaxID=3364375 RepID=UPI0037C63C7A